MKTFPEIIIIRHGETEWNKALRCQGQLDSSLTENGEAQAREMGRILRDNLVVEDYDVFISSAGRAAQTAALIGVEGRSEPRLQELYFGDWQGLYRHEIFEMTPEAEKWHAEEPFMWMFRAPNGERMGEFRERLQTVLDEINAPTIIVAHGMVSRVMRAMILGLDEDDMLALPGIQGEIYRMKDGVHSTLR